MIDPEAIVKAAYGFISATIVWVAVHAAWQALHRRRDDEEWWP